MCAQITVFDKESVTGCHKSHSVIEAYSIMQDFFIKKVIMSFLGNKILKSNQLIYN